jgi:acyl-CoA reductase-like NAD-dependent aldehyde dehydrogenase
MNANGERLGVRKMYKLYIGGAFARSESARSDRIDGENVARASRKDVRDAVVAARAAHEKWGAQTPALRGQILYRLAEMMEGRAAELAAQLVRGGTVEADFALRAPDEPALLGLVTAVLPALVSGNAVVVVASERDPRTAIVFAECLATSDLPGGACNVLTGQRAELAPVLAGHMDVNALGAFGVGAEQERALGALAAENVKRTAFEDAPPAAAWYDAAYDDLERILAYTELKTIWHPARI